MKTSKQILAEARTVWERQCRAHGLDPDDGPLRGAFNNLMQTILAQWLDVEDLFARQQRALGKAVAATATVYVSDWHEPLPGPGYEVDTVLHVAGCGCGGCAQERERERAVAFAGRVGG